MQTFSNGFQSKAQKNQLLKETLKKQLADPSYWYKTTAQQQLTKIEQEENEALWIKNNPNASLAELMYPSMRKSSTQTETNKNTNSDFNTNQASITNLNKPLLAENNSTLNRGEQSTFASQNNSSRTTSGSTTELNTELAQTIGGTQKNVQSVKANNTKVQGTGAENGTNLQRLSAVAQASEAIGAVNKPLGTLTNILGLAGELKSQSPQAGTANIANTQSIGTIQQQNTKQANTITQAEQIAQSHVGQIAQNAINSVKPQQHIEQFDNNQELNNQADDENKPTPLTEEYYNEITNGLPKISFQEMRNILGKMPMTKEEVVFLQKHPDWIEKILENSLDVTELMENYAKLEPTSEELRLKEFEIQESARENHLLDKSKNQFSADLNDLPLDELENFEQKVKTRRANFEEQLLAINEQYEVMQEFANKSDKTSITMPLTDFSREQVERYYNDRPINFRVRDENGNVLSKSADLPSFSTLWNAFSDGCGDSYLGTSYEYRNNVLAGKIHEDKNSKENTAREGYEKIAYELGKLLADSPLATVGGINPLVGVLAFTAIGVHHDYLNAKLDGKTMTSEELSKSVLHGGIANSLGTILGPGVRSGITQQFKNNIKNQKDFKTLLVDYFSSSSVANIVKDWLSVDKKTNEVTK